jgi:hypothetical protein
LINRKHCGKRSKEEDKKKSKMQTGKKNKWNLKKNMKD